MSAARVLATALVVGAVAGCAAVPLPEAIAGTTIVEGTFVDAVGVPIAGATASLSVIDWGDVDEPAIWSATTTTDVAGRFSFSGEPAPEMRDYIGDNEEVEFELTAVHPGTGAVAGSTVFRTLDGAGWTGDVPRIRLGLPS